MKKIFFIILCAPVLLHAQTDTGYHGIRFENGLSWNEIVAKARQENKFIFADCFATWCWPCKAMDEYVYPSGEAGTAVNSRFISVKIQIDTNVRDNEMVKKWYKDAHDIMQKYDITALPTFIFFSPDGKIVHRDVGQKTNEDFVKLVNNATDPRTQVYTLLEQFNEGKLGYGEMPALVNMVRTILKERQLAISIAQKYLEGYLYKLPDNELYTKKNIEFIGSYMQSSGEKGFSMFYHNGAGINALAGGKNYSENRIDAIITREEIDSRLWKDNMPIVKEPDWNSISDAVSRKYGEACAERVIVNAQIRWYNIQKNWPEVAKYNIRKIDKFGLDTSGLGKYVTNNMIWSVIFEHSNDKQVLNKGIEWIKILLAIDSTSSVWMDTYANLLYKLGRKKEAMDWEEKAVAIENNNAAKRKAKANAVYKETLGKMQQGLPTWPLDDK